MLIRIDSLDIHYKRLGSGDALIMLHGWGHNLGYFLELANTLTKSFTIYLLDLPGFGLSSLPNSIFSTNDYAKLVEKFIIQLNIDSPVILGHSFGGKITLHLATKNIPKKIIIMGSPGIKQPRPLGFYLRIHFFRVLKKISSLFSYCGLHLCAFKSYLKKFGSQDYRNAQGIMRKILVKVIEEDVEPLLTRITVPSLLIWGELDQETPVSVGKIMGKKLANSKLEIIPNGGHLLCLDNFLAIRKIIDEFLCV